VKDGGLHFVFEVASHYAQTQKRIKIMFRNPPFVRAARKCIPTREAIDLLLKKNNNYEERPFIVRISLSNHTFSKECADFLKREREFSDSVEKGNYFNKFHQPFAPPVSLDDELSRYKGQFIREMESRYGTDLELPSVDASQQKTIYSLTDSFISSGMYFFVEFMHDKCELTPKPRM